MITLTATILCSASFFLNTSGIPWNDHDKKILKRAEFVCGNDARYTENPCVHTFTKTEAQVYRVICGSN